MKNKKIIIAILVNSAIILFLIGFLIFQLAKLDKYLDDAETGAVIVEQAGAFGQENFHTQLELWEYLYAPNAERLKAFYDHKTVLEKELNDLIILGNTRDSAFYPNGVDDIQEIYSKWIEVDGSWKKLFGFMEEYLDVIEGNEAKGELENIKDPEVYEKLKILRQAADEAEKTFDDLEFNQNIRDFNAAQTEYLNNKLNPELHRIVTRYQILTLILLIFHLLLLVFIIIWLGNVLKLIREKSQKICER